MSIIITLLKSYAIWIYTLFALIAVFALRSALKARAEIRQSIFSLEKEFARNRAYRAAAAIVLMVLLAAALFAATHYAKPEPPPIVEATPTATRLLRATPTLAPEEITPSPTPTSTRARPTRQPVPTTPPVTPTPTVPPPPVCPTSGVVLSSPSNGAQLTGVTQVLGTADIEAFWYYKIEIGIGQNPSDWTVIGELHYGPVRDGLLGTVDAGAFPPEEYTLRLVVVNNSGNFPEPCAVRLTFTR